MRCWDQAQGPNAFSLDIFQTCWEVVKEDIMKVVPNFHAKGKFLRSLNAILLI